jgi:hypothetical protein
MAVYVTLMQVTHCIPLKALWDLTVTNSRCWSSNAYRISLTVTAVVSIVTDVILSLLPLTFVLSLNRPLRERIAIVLLMGLGLLVLGPCIVKDVVIQTYDPSNISSGINIALWSNIEGQLGIIAACIPCLKALFHGFLGRLGLVSESTNSRPSFAFSQTAVSTKRLWRAEALQRRKAA